MDYVIKLQVTVRADSPRHAEEIAEVLVETVREDIEDVSDYVLEVTADDAKEV